MQCPVDNETLVMADRNGVEIDYCPKCRGVWLDRGELDKIIERASGADPLSSPARAQAPVALREPGAPEAARRRERDHDHDDDDDDYRRRHKGKRRESFLGDLFDF